MFRVCKAELRKIFLRPSIFVVTGLLILVLAMSSFLYHPNNRDSFIVTAPSEYNSVSKYFSYFTTSSTESFAIYNDKIYLAENNFIEYYKNNIDYRDYLLNLIGEKDSTNPSTLVGAYSEFKTAYTNHLANPDSASALNVLNQKRDNFKKAFESFRTEYNENVVNNKNQQQKKVLSTSSLNLKVLDLIANCINAFNKSTEDINLYIIEQVGNQLKFREKLTSYVNELIPYSPNVEYLDSFNEHFTIVCERLKLVKQPGGTYQNSSVTDNELRAVQSIEEINNIYDKIRWYNLKYGVGDTNTSKQNIEEFKLLLTEYKLTALNLYNLVVNGIDLNVTSNYSNEHIRQFQGYENYNLYERKEYQVKLEYLFANNEFQFNYANPFSISQPSNTQTNCFDFAYFAMSLCMFVIITYIVVIAGTTIVGEMSSGTIKMLAIRPYSRTKLMAGKLLATLLIGVIIILISSLATFVMGLVLYGFNATAVLSVFNASSAVVISPILLFIIFIVSMIMELIFFIVLSLAISLLFKSQIVSIAISILIYVGTLVLNTLSAPILKFLPLTNINIFKYFGSSFLSTEGGFIEAALNSSVVMGADFIFTIIMYLITTIALLILSFVLFKKRDIK